MIGTRQEVKTFNNYLFTLEKQITAQAITNKYLGVTEEKPRNLVEVFQDHNDKVEALIGVDFRKPTLTKYNTTLKHVKNFLLLKYKVSDMQVSRVDNHFITEFSFYRSNQLYLTGHYRNITYILSKTFCCLFIKNSNNSILIFVTFIRKIVTWIAFILLLKSK